MRRTIGLALLVALAAAGCGNDAAREAEPYQGIWYSDAFGFYIVIEGGSIEVHEATSVSCVLVQEGSAAGISDVANLIDDRLQVIDQGREIVHERVAALPELCGQDFDSDDPTRSLEVMIAAFDEHYAFLAERAPDWDARAAAARSAVGPGTGPDELFDVVVGLLDPLGDAQIRVAVGDEELVEGSVWPSEDADPLAAALRAATTAGTFLQEGWRPDGAGGIIVGRTAGGAGYLGLTRLIGFDDTTESGIDEVAAVLDRLLADVGPEPGIVIDLRVNRGGFDVFAQVIASRFLPTERVVVSRSARIAATDDYRPAGDLTVTPLPTGTYQGPVVVLTGPATAGSAEVLVLALRGEDGVTVVGETTSGSLSPILPRVLPNGWVIGLSNQRVIDGDGVLWEVVGIPPDVTVPLTGDDLAAGRDPVLERADAILAVSG